MMENDKLLELFRAFEKHEVEYAVFGAVALGLHGLARATADLDVFLAPRPENVDRLKAALQEVFEDPNIDEISAEELCSDYPAVRYYPPEGFGLDIVTRLGEAFRYEDLEKEMKLFEDARVSVVSARQLWRLKKDTIRPADRIDAAVIAEHFGFEED
ncbi:MAG: hypothetical protein HC897_02985 [Thermoanaerobaculia bacterium]|nr:hypothetical protein [Thermoanaerobaculia bacterium]